MEKLFKNQIQKNQIIFRQRKNFLKVIQSLNFKLAGTIFPTRKPQCTLVDSRIQTLTFERESRNAFVSSKFFFAVLHFNSGHTVSRFTRSDVHPTLVDMINPIHKVPFYT